MFQSGEIDPEFGVKDYGKMGETWAQNKLGLGTIYAGVATPTEAAAVGAFGALIVAAVNRQLNRRAWKEANMEAVRLTVNRLLAAS